MTDAELMAGMRARKDAGSKLAADRIEQLAVTNEQLVATNEALTAENERLGQQCEGLMQAGMNNGQALILAEAKLAECLERNALLEARLGKVVKLIDLAVELARWDLNPKLRDDMIDFTTDLKGESHE